MFILEARELKLRAVTQVVNAAFMTYLESSWFLSPFQSFIAFVLLEA